MAFNKVNSLASGRCSNLKSVIFRHIIRINFMSTSCKIAFHLMPQNTFDGVMLIQVMAWCHQATNHYLSQCWPRSMSPYGVTKPQWVNTMHVVALALCIAWSSADMVQTTDDRHIVIFLEYGLVTPYGDMHLGQHWFRLPDGTKLLPEPMLTHQK